MIGAPADVRSRVEAIRAIASANPDGLIDCNLGTPCDPVPEFVRDAVAEAVAASGPYPLSAGSPAYRDAAARWIQRRLKVAIDASAIGACIGTKEFVASLPQFLGILERDTPGPIHGVVRDTVLYPEISYPTYAVGAQLAGCRAVPVHMNADWQLDLSSISADDRERALLLWINVPGNPTSATANGEVLADAAAWGREHGVLVASDECYVEFAPDAHTILENGQEGVLALHSLSKRSNFAGMRTGFYAGDATLVRKLIDLRREAGLIVPTPVQAGAVVALDDDAHVAVQCRRYEQRRVFTLQRLAAHGIEHAGGPMPFYLWLRANDAAMQRLGVRDGFDLATRFAEVGWLTAPGATFGTAGTPYTRIALVQPDDILLTALDRFDARNVLR